MACGRRDLPESVSTHQRAPEVSPDPLQLGDQLSSKALTATVEDVPRIELSPPRPSWLDPRPFREDKIARGRGAVEGGLEGLARRHAGLSS